MLDLSVVVLNYKTAHLTKACLDSLHAQILPSSGIGVVVVDNCSQDGSAEQIEHHIHEMGYSWAKLIRSPINGGFAAGNNLGIRAQPARYYLLLNSDTIVQLGCLKEFLRAAEANPKAGLIGGGFTDGHKPIPDAFTFPHPITELLRIADTGLLDSALRQYRHVAKHARTTTRTDWVPFAGVLIREELRAQIGDMDDQFFMYYEDVDYCLRAKQAGWEVICWPAARIIHHVGGSSGIQQGKDPRKRAPRYFYESRTRFFTKHFGHLGYLGANLAWHAGHTVSRLRALFGKFEKSRDNEARDIWTNAVTPYTRSSYLPTAAARTKLSSYL
jgi:GT2 family glycosyltransferase